MSVEAQMSPAVEGWARRALTVVLEPRVVVWVKVAAVSVER